MRFFAWRSTLVGLLFTLVSACSPPRLAALSSAELIVIKNEPDSQAPPIIKSKLGIARASGYQLLPKTIPFTSRIGSRVFCSIISFDQLTARPRPNWALGNTLFLPNRIVSDSAANSWITALLTGLKESQQQIYLGLVGAPSPYQQPLIEKPAGHPTPTNIPASAKLTAQWAQQALSDSVVNWSIWNEPEHTLRGARTEAAAREMADIYRSYHAALSALPFPSQGFGLASFMNGSLRGMAEDSTQSFSSVVFAYMTHSLKSTVDFVSINSYHGQTIRLINHLDSVLERADMDQPIVLTQFAPEIIGSHPNEAGSVLAASHYLENLDRFVRIPGLASACMSFWAGADRKALLREARGSFSFSLPFYALAWYQSLPLWRLPVQHASDMPYLLYAARDNLYFRLLIAPKPLDLQFGLPKGVKGKTERQHQRRALRQQDRKKHRVTERYDRPKSNAVITEETTLLHLQLPVGPHRTIQVERLMQGTTSPRVDRIQTDGSGRLSLPMASNQIVRLTAGAPDVLPSLRPVLRTDLYLHREAKHQGWASVDPIQDGFVLSLPSKRAVAHASATYAPLKTGTSLLVQLRSPQGLTAVGRALQCSAMVLQEMHSGSNDVIGVWGSLKAAQHILSSRAFGRQTTIRKPVAWGKYDNDGLLRLDIPSYSTGGGRSLRFHFAAAACEPGTQLQVRILR